MRRIILIITIMLPTMLGRGETQVTAEAVRLEFYAARPVARGRAAADPECTVRVERVRHRSLSPTP